MNSQMLENNLFPRYHLQVDWVLFYWPIYFVSLLQIHLISLSSLYRPCLLYWVGYNGHDLNCNQWRKLSKLVISYSCVNCRHGDKVSNIFLQYHHLWYSIYSVLMKTLECQLILCLHHVRVGLGSQLAFSKDVFYPCTPQLLTWQWLLQESSQCSSDI